jgi:hypothetical protein
VDSAPVATPHGHPATFLLLGGRRATCPIKPDSRRFAGSRRTLYAAELPPSERRRFAGFFHARERSH